MLFVYRRQPESPNRRLHLLAIPVNLPFLSPFFSFSFSFSLSQGPLIVRAIPSLVPQETRTLSPPFPDSPSGTPPPRVLPQVLTYHINSQLPRRPHCPPHLPPSSTPLGPRSTATPLLLGQKSGGGCYGIPPANEVNVAIFSTTEKVLPVLNNLGE